MTVERDAAVEGLLAVARGLAGERIDREGLAAVTTALRDLAARRELFPLDDFPLADGRRSVLYVVAEDAESGAVLYAARSEPVEQRPAPRPHNHTTWAAVATVYGDELQELYERMDDGTTPGRGELRSLGELTITPGTVIGYLPDDFHSVAVVGDQSALSLHFYGKGLDTLTERIIFEGATGGAYEPFIMGRELFTPLPAAVHG